MSKVATERGHCVDVTKLQVPGADSGASATERGAEKVWRNTG